MLNLVLALMLALDPSAPTTNDAHAFALAIAEVAEKEPRPEGVSRELAAATLVVYGWHEGRYALRVKHGDGGKAHCAFQVHAVPGSSYARVLESSAKACTLAAWGVMRESWRLCGDLSGYCGACRKVTGERAALPAIRIATARAREATGLVDRVLTEYPELAPVPVVDP